MTTLCSTRTKLRRLCPSDLDNMIILESDPEIVKFTPYRIPQNRENTKIRLEKVIQKSSQIEPYGVWAAEHNEQFIGWFMLQKTDLPHPEIGFMMVKKFWNMGFAQEICLTLIRYAFDELKLSQIQARTDNDNEKSITILKKLGFHKEKETCEFDPVLKKNQTTYIFSLKKPLV